MRPISTSWVNTYDPKKASNGYTLTLHDIRVPVLLDMNGRAVHAWPDVRLKSRVRLLPDGSILGIGLGHTVAEYDWDGKLTWEFEAENAVPHHDVIRLVNGNTLVLVLRDGDVADTLLEVDRAGKVQWTWRADEHLKELLPPGARAVAGGDATHFNSLQELPRNPWFDSGDRRFRPGNILLSARNLNSVLIVERPSGRIVWRWSGELDRQHEALMNGPGVPGPGLIQILDNRQGSFNDDRQSAVLEIDPRNGKIVWQYSSPGFFTPTSGTAQALPNGNVLVTSSRGGRAFEVTRQGELVWEWAPPYEPIRALRVPHDACPQLAAMTPPIGRAVMPSPGYRYIDSDVYRFARRNARANVPVNGEDRSVLKDATTCRTLLLPVGGKLEVGYGVDRARLQAAGAKPASFIVRARNTSGPDATPEPGPGTILFEDRVGLDGEPWRTRDVPLDAFSLKTVELCLEIDGIPLAPKPAARFAFWEPPDLETALDLAREQEEKHAFETLTPQERKVQLEHLKSLGYIN